MKKLFLSMAILFAMGIVFTACGDDASGDTKEASGGDGDGGDVCDCLMNAQSEEDALACSPGKSIDELEKIMRDCMDAMPGEDGDDGEMMDDASDMMDDASDMMDGASDMMDDMEMPDMGDMEDMMDGF